MRPPLKWKHGDVQHVLVIKIDDYLHIQDQDVEAKASTSAHVFDTHTRGRGALRRNWNAPDSVA